MIKARTERRRGGKIISKPKQIPAKEKAIAHITAPVKIVKALTRPDADPKEIERRRRICETCEHFLPGAGGRCKLCGCFYRAKIRLKNERCPAGKW